MDSCFFRSTVLGVILSGQQGCLQRILWWSRAAHVPLTCRCRLFNPSHLQVRKLRDSFKITQTALAGEQHSQRHLYCLCSPAVGLVFTPPPEQNRTDEAGLLECDRWRKAVGTTGFDKVGKSRPAAGRRRAGPVAQLDTPLLL